MIWFILTVCCILFSIFGAVLAFVEQSSDWVAGSLCTGVLAFVIGLILVASFIKLSGEANQMSYPYLDVNIQNKLSKIDQMKNSFRESKSNNGSQVNIDMVNKDLTIGITNQIQDLEAYILKINNRLAVWNVNYKYRFFNAYLMKPPLDKPILLSDYLK